MSTGHERRAAPAPRQRVSTLIQLAIAWSTGFAVIAAVALQTAVPSEVLLLDRAAVSGGRWYQGMVTSFGILAWTVAAMSCAGSSLVARLAARPRAARAFGSGAVLLAFLMLDDLFQLHSNVVPAALGVPKSALVLVEAIATAFWLASSRAEIVRTRWELLAAAGAGLGLSLVVDSASLIGDPRWSLLVEDGAKFLGVLALATWAVSTARDLATSTVRVTPEPRPTLGAARRIARQPTVGSSAVKRLPVDV
jgi:hypothetical protein